MFEGLCKDTMSIDKPLKATGKPQSSNSKWLFILLAITLMATAWTAFNGKSTFENGLNIEPQLSVEQVPAGNATLNNGITSEKNSDNIGGVNNREPLAQSKPLQPSDHFINEKGLIPWQRLARAPFSTQSSDLFTVHSWRIEKPVKKIMLVPEIAPPPVAPPAPFTYLGKFEESPNNPQIFLMANNQLYSVNKGEKINEVWRFDNEDISTLYFTYLPLNMKQKLAKSAVVALPKPSLLEPSLFVPETSEDLIL